MMVPVLERGLSVSKSFHFKRIFQSADKHSHSSAVENGKSGEVAAPESQSSEPPGNSPLNESQKNDKDDIVGELPSLIGSSLSDEKGPVSRPASVGGNPGNRPEKQPSDTDMMKEKFAKLLLGEDMSGGGKGVSSALALSNAITNLAASIFGEQTKLQPMAPDKKARWKKEVDWLLSVTDHIVEFVPQQMTKDGVSTDIMVTKQRGDLLMNIPALRKLDAMLIEAMDHFKGPNEFSYVSRDSEEANGGRNQRQEEKWWLPTVKVPPNGLSDVSRRWMFYHKDACTQVQKAAMAINAQVLSEMEIPESYIEALPKNGRASLGDSIYKSITEDWFNPEQFLSMLDLTNEHTVLDLKNRIEASVVIWKRKLNLKDTKSSWVPAVSLEKRELFEERAETILVLLKQQFPALPQSSLDISKIQENKDVGQAVLESYSRILESLAYNVMSRIEDVLYADSMAMKALAEGSSDRGKTETDPESARSSNSGEDADTPNSKTLLDFMGWGAESEKLAESHPKSPADKPPKSPNNLTPKKHSYLEKLENLNAFRTGKERH